MVKPYIHTLPRTAVFTIAVELSTFKEACLQWSDTYSPVAFYDSNSNHQDPYGQYEALLAVGAESDCILDTAQGAFDHFKEWYEREAGWAFGYLSYDLKNDVEKLTSANPDQLDFPNLHFFRPTYVIELFSNQIRIHSQAEAPESIFHQILSFCEPKQWKEKINTPPIQITARIPKKEYLDKVYALQEHIKAGDIYEINFCQEFFAEEAEVDPLKLFQRFNRQNQAPFAAYLKLGNQYLLSGSPERFLQKRDDQLISQPIKGTISRSGDLQEDQKLKEQLYHSEKDRAENVMIVDLVRNDLSRSCLPGTVKVEELFGIYPFKQVHHMISTISGQLRPEVHFLDALKAAFPMGSMTGAPKVMSMELIEHYEQSRRGLYSGAVGYITPEGDFDFNVVIRSMLYRADTKYLSYHVGGAIVYDSVPESEYEECLLKARGILQALGIQESGLTENPKEPKSSQNPG